MALLFFFLLLASLVALLVGLIKPSLVGWWSKNATRGQVLWVYLLASVLAFVLWVAFIPHPNKQTSLATPSPSEHTQAKAALGIGSQSKPISLTTPKVTEVAFGEALDVPGLSSKGRTVPYGINSSGQIVGSFYNYEYNGKGPTHGLLRDTNGSFTTIDVPGSTWTETYGINSSSQIVGKFYDSKGFHGFLALNLPPNSSPSFYYSNPCSYCYECRNGEAN